MSSNTSKRIFLLAGWGTDPRIFYRINFEPYEATPVIYFRPNIEDSIEEYATKIIEQYGIKNGDALVGCSLGGLLAIEIGKQIQIEKIALISSVKHWNELPKKITRWKRVPIRKIPANGLVKWYVARFSYLLRKLDEIHQQHFRQMVLDNDDLFLVKSLEWIVHWKNEVIPENLLQINGDRDIIFPIENISKPKLIPNGDHAMVINRVDGINELIADFLKDEELPTYTKSQLALRNGEDKPEIWVAYQGLIYDVKESRLWHTGKHYEHWAGQDLTTELENDAPHTKVVFEKFKAIGRLATTA